jgi:hypothetical protein
VFRCSKQLGALVPCVSKRCEPRAAATADGRRDSDGFDVDDCSRAPEESDVGGEGRLKAGFALFA